MNTSCNKTVPTRNAANQAGNHRTNVTVAAAMAADANRAKSDAFAARVLPIIADIQASGVTTSTGIAAALEEQLVPTARGRRWRGSQVRRALARAA